MKHSVRILGLIAPLLFCCIAYASPADAGAVIQSCGVPLSDITTAPADGSTPQRVLHYRDSDLYFQQDDGGWNFIYSTTPANDRRRDRDQTSDLVPCFQRAMVTVRSYAAAPLAQQSSTQPQPTLQQWIMQPVFGIRRIGYLPLLLLYLLPSLIAWVRKAPRTRRLVLINIFLGWTILGWAYALLLSNRDPLDDVDDDAIPADVSDPESGILHLKLIEPSDVYDEPHISAPMPRPARRSSSRPTRIAATPRPAAAPTPSARSAVPESAPRPAASIPRTLPAAAPRSAPEPAPRPSAPEPISRPASEPPARPAAPESIPPLRFTTATTTARLVEPLANIHWTEQISPLRHCRIEVAWSFGQPIVYEMDLTQRGFDKEGREYLGGYCNRNFLAFPVEKILTLREFAA